MDYCTSTDLSFGYTTRSFNVSFDVIKFLSIKGDQNYGDLDALEKNGSIIGLKNIEITLKDFNVEYF